MTIKCDPILKRKIELDKNPTGTELKVLEQKEREKKGRYVKVNERTRIFVRDGEDVEAKIAAYNNRLKNRPEMWN